MQPERQVSVALVGIGAALVIPEFAALLHHPEVTPGVGLVVGGVLGALGVFLGTLIASGQQALSARGIGLTIWILAGIAFGGPLLFGAMHPMGWVRHVIFGLAGLLPIAGPIVIVIRRHDPSS